MKNKIIIGLILALSISMVGCNDKKEASSKGDTNVNQEESNSGTSNEKDDNEEDSVVDTTVKISDEEMVDIFNKALPTIKEFYENICPETLIVKYGGDGDAPDPNQLTVLNYTNYDIATIGQASILTYLLAYNEDGSVINIRGTIDLNYDTSKIATEGFNFEENELYTVVEALIGTGHDYSQLNEQVQKYYQGEDVDRVAEFEAGNFIFSINCEDNGLYFGYTYFNERS